jgi:hypothetical protein
VVVPEWLSGMTRNHVGFARAGSNPADHAFFFISSVFSHFLLFVPTRFSIFRSLVGPWFQNEISLLMNMYINVVCLDGWDPSLFKFGYLG